MIHIYLDFSISFFGHVMMFLSFILEGFPQVFVDNHKWALSCRAPAIDHVL